MAALITTFLLMTCFVGFTAVEYLKFHRETKVTQQRQHRSIEPVSLGWGIGDAIAYVGKRFTFKLPNDAFRGSVERYHVYDGHKSTLPSFLDFNTSKSQLQGVPGPDDEGRIYLEVVAIGEDFSLATDVFSIEVRKTAHVLYNCQQQTYVILTLIVDCDLDSMRPTEKVELIDALAVHLSMSAYRFTLLPVGRNPMFDSNALLTGPGNVQSPESAGSLLSWVIGCGPVEEVQMAILQLVVDSTKNGNMTRAIGHGIIGWQVTDTRFQKRTRQRKGRATATMTSTPTLAPPMWTWDLNLHHATTTIAATSVVDMPTQTVEMNPATGVIDPHEAVQEGTILSSSTVRMHTTTEATTSLPYKTYTLTSSVENPGDPATASARKTKFTDNGDTGGGDE